MVEIKEKNGWWYIVNAAAFYAYPFPTRQDAEDVAQSVILGRTYDSVHDSPGLGDVTLPHDGLDVSRETKAEQSAFQFDP